MSERYEWTDGHGVRWVADGHYPSVRYEHNGELFYASGAGGANAAIRELLRLAPLAPLLDPEWKPSEEGLAALPEKVRAHIEDLADFYAAYQLAEAQAENGRLSALLTWMREMLEARAVEVERIATSILSLDGGNVVHRQPAIRANLGDVARNARIALSDPTLARATAKYAAAVEVAEAADAHAQATSDDVWDKDLDERRRMVLYDQVASASIALNAALARYRTARDTTQGDHDG